MKICMLLMTAFTHDARVTKEALSLIKNGHKVTFYALKDKDSQNTEKRHGFTIHRINLSLRYLLPKGQLFFFIKYLEYIIRTIIVLLNKPFDVYHAHDLETLPIAVVLGKLKHKPIIYDSHELYTETVKHHPIARKFWRRLEKFLATKCDMTIHVSESAGRYYARRYRTAMPEIIMNCPAYSQIKKADTFRRLLPIKESEKIILYQGLIHPARGTDILLEAMNYIDNAILVFLGPGEYLEKLRKKVSSHPRKKKIFVLDPVPVNELPKFTASADIGVALIQNECLNYYFMLPNKLFEFLAAGLPVVFSDFPEVRKIINNHHVGFVVDETNPKKIAEAIWTILSDYNLAQEMSHNARKIIRNHYNWESEEKKLHKIYTKIAGKKYFR